MRKIRFTFVCDQEEKRLLDNLANRLDRSMSDTVRYLIRKKVEEFSVADNKEVTFNKSVKTM